jgi:hypothetical protein
MNYGFVNRIMTTDGTGIPGGVGGGAGYEEYLVFYFGVPDVEAGLQKAQSLGGKHRMGPSGRRQASWSAAAVEISGPGLTGSSRNARAEVSSSLR